MLPRRNWRVVSVVAMLAGIGPAAFAQDVGNPKFDVATIKQMNPEHNWGGVKIYPSGRFAIGAFTLKDLVWEALDVDEHLVIGGPEWASTDRYDVSAVEPESLAQKEIRFPERWTMNDNERKMLLALLVERFGLKFHRTTKDMPVYFLTRGSGKLLLMEPKDRSLQPAVGVISRGEFAAGETRGRNASMAQLARTLSVWLERPVVDQTGLMGIYDFWVKPFAPENKDMDTAIFGAMTRLGLKMKLGRAPVETIVIDGAVRPTEN
jgi:uncharacterized protein (TIGR03435 family)